MMGDLYVVEESHGVEGETLVDMFKKRSISSVSLDQ